MRKTIPLLLLLASNHLLATPPHTTDFIQSAYHKQHTQRVAGTITPTTTLSRTEEWNLADTPTLYTKITAVTFYSHTNATTGKCEGIGRTLDLSHNHFINTGIAVNGPAGDLRPIAIHTSGITAAANTLGFTLPSDDQGCAKLDIAYQAGPTTTIPNTISTSISPETFEYGHIASHGNNSITDGTPINNHAQLLKTATLSLTRTAHARCWGLNSQGQLGDDTRSNSNLPVKVSNALGNGVVKISSGRNHNCALLQSGTVKCWGQNTHGQLGDDSATNSLIPVQVYGLTSGVIDIAAGRDSTCALLNSGSVKCWGDNKFWQLGDGTRTNRYVPTNVNGLRSGVTSITSGYMHACALLKSGQIKCWGAGINGQLGNNSIKSQKTPVFVANIGGNHPKATAIAAGARTTCAIINKGGFIQNGDMECWGANTYGQVGDSTTTKRLIPTQVQGLTTGVTAISMGTQHTCAITNGDMKCWGDNTHGQLGIQSASNINPTPQKVDTLPTGVKAISAVNSHTCAINSNGRTQCWGLNDTGQLGTRVPVNEAHAPINTDLPIGSSTILSQGNDSAFSCAATNSAQITTSQLDATANTVSLTNVGHSASSFNTIDLSSRGITSNCASTLDSRALCNFTYDGTSSRGDGAISVTDNHNKTTIFPFHIKKSGKAVCWGYNRFGQLGDDSTTNRNIPVDVHGIDQAVIQVVTGRYHSCALLKNHSVMCWGDNTYGQLGNRIHQVFTRAIYVDAFRSLGDVVSLSAGNDHTCALLYSGKVKCWGKNDSGQLGDGSIISRDEPVNVHALPTTVTALTSGNNHTCALLKTGRMKCWGNNDSGQLGDSTQTSRNKPVDVSNLNDTNTHVVAMSAGQNSNCALLSNGAMKCWGKSSSGQLGNGRISVFEAKPQQVIGLTSGVAAISQGGTHACALLQNGSVQCWGSNNSGQLGIGSNGTKITIPQPVTALGTHVVSINAKKLHTCALLADGTVQCFGKNVDGQLGNGSFTASNLPVTVSNLSHASELAINSGVGAYNCAIK